MPTVFRFLVPLLWTTTLLAQAAYFGPRATLTNTRYGAIAGPPALVTNGSERFVLVSTEHNVRMARLTDTIARPVLRATDGDAAWTGSHFLLVGTARGAIVGRMIAASGEPAGEPFTIVERGTRPRLVRDGERLMLLYEDGGVQWLVLSRDGAPSGSPQNVATNARAFDIASHRGELVAVLATDDGVKLIGLGANGKTVNVSDAVANDVSVAANGERIVVAWTDGDGVKAAVVENGIPQEAFTVGAGAKHAALLWNGSAFDAIVGTDGGLRVGELNPGARSAETKALELLGASEQTLVATASLPSSTLFVWNEGGDAHVGLRAANGAWRERVLAANEGAVAATSDGHAFVVVTSNGDGWSAAWLDGSGAVVQQSKRVAAFRARAIAANASAAVVIGRNANGDIVAARVQRDGAVSDAVKLRASADDPVIAGDGMHFIAAWETPEKTIESVRVDTSLQRLDATDLVVFGEGEDPAVAFNGRDYVFVARVGEFVRGRRVTRAGEKVFETVQIGRAGGDPPRSLALTPLDGLLGLTWHDGRSQLMVLDFSAAPWRVQTVDGYESHAAAAPRLVALPDRRVAFVHAEPNDGAPHHGSARVAMTLAHPTPPVAPDAPVAAVAAESGRLRVSWNAPSQPVNGYRVEYRIDDGPWLEAEGWSDSGTDTMSIAGRQAGLYTVRVRAWSDAGVSAYSAPVSVQFTPSARRRAVR